MIPDEVLYTASHSIVYYLLSQYNIGMLTIYCGDNVVESRQNFVQHKKRLGDSGIEMTDIPRSDMSDVNAIIHGSASLFNERRAFCCENVLSKKVNRDLLKAAIEDTSVECLVWEGSMDDRSIKRYFPKAKLFVSKLPSNIWKFLDGVYPGNARYLISTLPQLTVAVDEHMVLYLLQRRIKDLILVLKGLSGKRKLAPWQAQNMKNQAIRWGDTDQERLNRLHKMYQKLNDIEIGVKTRSLSYPVQKALDILFSFYVQ